MKRCRKCWNHLDYCTCEVDPSICQYHHPRAGRRPSMHACTCVDPMMFECDVCENLNVPAKKPGIGYVCDDCMMDYL